MVKKITNWIDCLTHKHECWDYDHCAATIEIEFNGDTTKLTLPKYFVDWDVKAVSKDGNLITIIGREKKAWDKEEHLGVLIVAKVVEPGHYSAVIFHQLYPWALQFLGLESEETSKTKGKK